MATTGGFRSMRWRLTLPYVALLAILLLAMDVSQYFALRNSLIDARVTSMTGDVEAARTAFARLPGTGTAVEKAQRYATVVQLLSGRTVDVVVYDATLNVIATSPQGAVPPKLSADQLRVHGAHSEPQIVDGQDGPVLAVAYEVVRGSRGSALVQLTTPMTPITSVLNFELLLLAATSLLALLLALGIGALLIRRGLRPLARLTATTSELAAGNLGARTQLEHRRDEVGRLGMAIDEMAAKLQTSFTTQAQSENQIRRFVADASHELRTPVTSIKGYIDVLRRGAGRDPASLDAVLVSMQREADRLRVLVLDLLTLARIDADEAPQQSAVDVNTICNTVLDEGVNGMPPVLRRNFAAQPVVAKADADAVGVVARNLLVNACNHAPGAGQVWETAVENDRAVLRVADAGPGIPAADLPHIFERFYRGSAARERDEGGGSGLGLSIVSGLVQRMGGDITVESLEGRGTTFEVTLPLARDAAA